MPRLVMTTTHRLGREEAQRRLTDKLSAVLQRYGRQVSDLHEEWNESRLSFSFQAMGMRVAGTIAVEDTEVRLTAQLPFAAVMFKSLIERSIREELGNVLA